MKVIPVLLWFVAGILSLAGIAGFFDAMGFVESIGWVEFTAASGGLFALLSLEVLKKSE